MKILLSGYYGYQNVGDDLLLKTLIGELTSIEKVTELNVPVRDIKSVPIDDSKRVNYIRKADAKGHKVFNLIRLLTFEFSQLRKNDVLVYGGGTRLFETSGRGYYSLLVKFILLKLNALFLRRKVIHLGVGVGNIYSKKGKWLFKQILLLSDCMLLRDESSYKLVKSVVGNRRHVLMGSDLIFLSNPLSSVSAARNFNSGTKRIGLSLFQYYGYISRETSKAEAFKTACQELISSLLTTNPNVEIYLFSFQRQFGGKDQQFNNELHADIASGRLFHVEYTADTFAMLSTLRQMDLCIGMRYHFCLLSLSFDIPTIGINYQPKLLFEFASLGLEKFCFEVDEIDQLKGCVEQVLSKNDEVNQVFARASQSLGSRSSRLRKSVCEIYKSYFN